MNNAQVVEDLKAAREYLFSHGWHQGAYENDQGQVCAMGAITKSTGPLCSGRAYEATIAFYSGIGEFRSVTRWNDEPERTFDQVVDAFDLAIKKAEQP